MANYDKRRALQTRKVPLISVAEVQRIKRRIAEEKAYLGSFGGTPEGDGAKEAHLSPRMSGRPVDEESVRTRIRRSERALQLMSPEGRKFIGADRRKADKAMREAFEAWLQSPECPIPAGTWMKSARVEEAWRTWQAASSAAAPKRAGPVGINGLTDAETDASASVAGLIAAPAAPTTHPCRSPYCECDRGKCTHPGFHDARHEPLPR